MSTVDLPALVQAQLGIELTPGQIKAFDVYAAELSAWNQRFNLTAITDPDEVRIKHFLDSLTCLLAMGRSPAGRIVDIGTGAGFPGLPLKILCPRLSLTLIESVEKKADFCHHMVDVLGLSRVEVLHARAETVAHLPAHRASYDWAVARAVAALPVLLEYLLPFLRVGGAAVAQKGDTAPAEVASADEALQLLGGAVERLIPVELPQVVEKRYLVVVSKVAATPEGYPRRPGVPAKRPLGA